MHLPSIRRFHLDRNHCVQRSSDYVCSWSMKVYSVCVCVNEFFPFRFKSCKRVQRQRGVYTVPVIIFFFEISISRHTRLSGAVTMGMNDFGGKKNEDLMIRKFPFDGDDDDEVMIHWSQLFDWPWRPSIYGTVHTRSLILKLESIWIEFIWLCSSERNSKCTGRNGLIYCTSCYNHSITCGRRCSTTSRTSRTRHAICIGHFYVHGNNFNGESK